MFKQFFNASIAVGTAVLLSVAFLTKKADSQSSASPHLTLGNPSAASTSTTNANNYLMIKPQYALSYNNSKKIANWVSWQLNSSWLGSTPRQDDFRADTTLPSGWYRVNGSDYSSSGFDRGHMTPSADRTNSVSSNSATFLMTNMIPQAPDNNQGVWANLEAYERDLVINQGKELYIISGGYGSCGTGSNGSKCYIPAATNSNYSITVPARTWKIIVVTNPGSGVTGINTNTRVVVVDIPNTQGVRSADWKNYRVSVDDLEAQTGYDFLSEVSTSIQNTIEAQVDNQ